MTEALRNEGVAGAISLLGAATILGFSNIWFLALAGHFRRHIASAALVLAPLALLATWPSTLRILICGAALAICAFNIAWTRRAMPRSPAAPSDGVTLRVVFANLLDSNTEFRPFIAWVKTEKADIVMASEVTDRWVAALGALEPQLPYGHGARPGEVALLSRLPLVGSPADPALSFARLATADVATAAGPVQLVVVHPRVPTRGAALAAINARAIAAVGSLAGNARGGVIAAGDFNSTPWSPALRRIVAEAGLAYGVGAGKATWPTWLPIWLGLPLDHILVGRGCTIVELRHGPNIGSDHRPIVADVRVSATPVVPGESPRRRYR